MTLEKYQFDGTVPAAPGGSHHLNPAAAGKVSSNIISVDRRGPGHTVFHVDESVFTTTQPKTSHWSIAWSDLMMTMFILFLSMFIYKKANENFLEEGGREIIGGDTTEALQVINDSSGTLPSPPIKQGLPLITAGTIKKVEPIPSSEEETRPQATSDPVTKEIIPEKTPGPQHSPYLFNPQTAHVVQREPDSPLIVPADGSYQPRPQKTLASTLETEDSFNEIYRLSIGTLAINNLNKFASIDLVPDKTMRIILTGDLLFDLGKSDLSETAISSLTKIAQVVSQSPHMINVVGHTDNIPMFSEKFKNNWELSLSRANTVAQFLIEDAGMNPNQFVVSGYSSYRPTVPNNSISNRAKNRRVEIIISKRLPAPTAATQQNLR